jgi:glycosyltransferase involved in cell wall biosynthesis
MEAPIVSVIVPVRNRLPALRRCLTALAAQRFDFQRAEFIIVDNGSEDDVAGVCREFAWVKYLREPGFGSYAARNRGLTEARGAIIAFTDSDCMPEPTWLQAGVAAIQREDCDILAGRVSYPPAPNGRLNIYETIEERLFSLECQKRLVEKRGYGATANLFVKKELFDRVGLFRSNMPSLADVEWGKRAVEAGAKPRYCDESAVIHPRRSDLASIVMKIRRGAGGRHQLRLAHRQRLRASWEAVTESPLSPKVWLFGLCCPGVALTARPTFLGVMLYLSALATVERTRITAGGQAFRGD